MRVNNVVVCYGKENEAKTIRWHYKYHCYLIFKILYMYLHGIHDRQTHLLEYFVSSPACKAKNGLLV